MTSVANIGYPTYHTAYETFDLVERIVDPGFHLLALSTKMTLSLVRDFAENIVLDFDLQDYNTIMDEFKSDPEVTFKSYVIPYQTIQILIER